MKEIEQIVTDYLNSEKTDYAIMINGDWGSGKTYYIKKTLVKKISETDSFTKDKKYNILKYEPLYVSLYGINDISDVLYKVQLELNPWLKTKPWMITKTGLNKLASFFSLDFSKEDERNFLSIYNIRKNKVLIFDDLERIDKEKLSLSSVLGQINNFTEQENIKVIIVCNSEETEEIFSKINEKTIRFSCTYNPLLGDVFDNMVLVYNQDYSTFLKNNKQTILDIFKVAKYKNLRTLKFILDVFQKIYNIDIDKKYKDEILKRFLFFTVIYAIEYKIDTKSKEKLNSLKNAGPIPLLSLDLDKFLSEKQEVKKEEAPNYIDLFNEKYSSIINSFHYCQEIADYIHDGYLSEEKLTVVIEEFISEKRRLEGTEEDKLIKQLENWKNLKNEDFEPLKDKIMGKIDEGSFPLAAYPAIFAEFLQIEHYNLYDFKVDGKVIDRFVRGIDKAKEAHEYSNSFRGKISFWRESDTSEARGKFNNIVNYCMRANDDALYKIYKGIIEALLASIENNKSQELQDLITDPEHLNSPLFEFIDEGDFFTLLTNAETETIYAFNAGIYSRYGDSDIETQEVYNKEKEFFMKLYELIHKKIEDTKDRKISIVPFILLERNLRRFIKLN